MNYAERLQAQDNKLSWAKQVNIKHPNSLFFSYATIKKNNVISTN